MHIARASAGGVGIAGLQSQIEQDPVALHPAGGGQQIADERIPHRIDGHGEAAAGFKRQHQPLVEGKGAE